MEKLFAGRRAPPPGARPLSAHARADPDQPSPGPAFEFPSHGRREWALAISKYRMIIN